MNDETAKLVARRINVSEPETEPNLSQDTRI